MSRRSAFSDAEKKGLINILGELNVVEDRKTDAASIAKKNELWLKITEVFNASSCCSQLTTTSQLRRLWANIKVRQRRGITKAIQHRRGTGGGPSIPEPEIDPDVARIAPALIVGVDGAIDSDSFVDLTGTPANVERPRLGKIVPPTPSPPLSHHSRSLLHSQSRSSSIFSRCSAQDHTPQKLPEQIVSQLSLAHCLENTPTQNITPSDSCYLTSPGPQSIYHTHTSSPSLILPHRNFKPKTYPQYTTNTNTIGYSTSSIPLPQPTTQPMSQLSLQPLPSPVPSRSPRLSPLLTSQFSPRPLQSSLPTPLHQLPTQPLPPPPQSWTQPRQPPTELTVYELQRQLLREQIREAKAKADLAELLFMRERE